MKNSIIILIFTLLLTACSSDKDDPIDDPVNDITYVKNIKSIIDSKCVSCHSNPPTKGAPMALISLENVKEAVEDRDLIGRVTNGSMPPGSEALSSDQIELIKDWEINNFK